MVRDTPGVSIPPRPGRPSGDPGFSLGGSGLGDPGGLAVGNITPLSDRMFYPLHYAPNPTDKDNGTVDRRIDMTPSPTSASINTSNTGKMGSMPPLKIIASYLQALTYADALALGNAIFASFACEDEGRPLSKEQCADVMMRAVAHLLVSK